MDGLSPDLLLGPLGALALAVVFLGLFYTGRVLSRNTVPREDYDKAIGIIASYAPLFSESTAAVKDLTALIKSEMEKR